MSNSREFLLPHDHSLSSVNKSFAYLALYLGIASLCCFFFLIYSVLLQSCFLTCVYLCSFAASHMVTLSEHFLLLLFLDNDFEC